MLVCDVASSSTVQCQVHFLNLDCFPWTFSELRSHHTAISGS